MKVYYEYVVVGLLLAILSLQIYNMQQRSPPREGFQMATGEFIKDPANNPSTCVIMLSVREQLLNTLQKLTEQADIDRIKISINTTNEQITKFNCTP